MRKFVALVVFPVLVANIVTPAAAVTTISSSAYALSSTVRAVSAVAVTVGPVVPVSGTAAPAYDNNSSALMLNTTVNLFNTPGVASGGLNIGTGVLTTNAMANGVTPGFTNFGSSSASVDNLALGLFLDRALLPSITTLSAGADMISSTTSVTRMGNAGATLVGASNFTGLNVELLSLLNVSLFSLNANGNVQFAPNTVLGLGILPPLGLTITLNEQIAGGSGNILSLMTNALHVKFDNFLLGSQLLTGDIIVSHSEASINIDPTGPLPEPAIWAQLIVGFGLAGTVMRRRRPALG